MPFCPNCGAGTSGAACEVCGHKAQLPQAHEASLAPPVPPPLEVGGVIKSAVADSFGILRKLVYPIAIVVAVATICGLLISDAPSVLKHLPHGMNAFNAATTLFDIVIIYFLMAESVRTIYPEFRMTFFRCVALIGWSVFAGVLIALSAFALIVPFFWVAPKILIAPYAYLLSAGRDYQNPIALSWRITTGHYWTTWGLYLLLFLIALAVSIPVALIAAVFSMTSYAGIAIGVPLDCLISVWIYAVCYLAYTRWTYLLMERDSGPHTALLPAS